MFFSMVFFCVAATCQVVFPCTFPCDWINKTLRLYSDYGHGPQLHAKLSFNADGTTGINLGSPFSCFQISEQFLIIKTKNWDGTYFSCYATFYTSGQSKFSLFYPAKRDKRIENRVVAFNKSEICEICNLDTGSIGPLLAIEQPEFPKEIPPAACKVPSFCPSDSGAVCPQGGSIPKCIITCRGRRRK